MSPCLEQLLARGGALFCECCWTRSNGGNRRHGEPQVSSVGSLPWWVRVSTWGHGRAPPALPQSLRASRARSTQGSEPANNSPAAPMSVQCPPRDRHALALRPDHVDLHGSPAAGERTGWGFSATSWSSALCSLLSTGLGLWGWLPLLVDLGGLCSLTRQPGALPQGLAWLSLPLRGSLEEPRASRQRETPAKEIH